MTVRTERAAAGTHGTAGTTTASGSLWDRGHPLGRACAAIDDAGERWSATLRGRRWADVAASALSNLSDHGVVWVLTAGWAARRPGLRRRRAVVTLAFAGISSYGVNRALKRAAARSRPEVGETTFDPRFVRAPSSSSFPSGHTLASFCTAVVLPDAIAGRRVALGFATAVAASRVHLRAHHTSDVLAGAVAGAALGAVVRPLADAVVLRRTPGRWRAE
ncbi:MAG TPA: phosphatase PAP2 family protein [Acidimicrobiales bacterium]|nr:phosphatase PAP2 family protein [Acidimicrobiales bacterium]